MKPIDISKFQKTLSKSMTNISFGFKDPSTWIHTGNYALNYRVSGDFKKGFPLEGKMTLLAGESGSGKSFVASGNIAKWCQDNGVLPIIIDTENALDESWMRNFGIDPNGYIMKVSANLIDDIAKIMSDFIKEYKGNYASSYEIGNETYEEYIQPYWDCQRFRLHEAYSDHPTDVNYYCNNQNLHKELHKGYKFAYVNSHGLDDCWILNGLLNYIKIQADSLINKSYTNIVTVACHTNDFIEECLGESFINNKDGGIISYLGSSQSGWSTTSHVFIQYFFKTLLNSSSQQIGKALYDTKNIFISNISNNSTHRWLYLSMNLLGDPELSVYLSYPKRFYNVNIAFNGGSLSINTGVSDCRICISSLNDNNFYIVENGIRTLELENFNKDCYICITKPGYIPYIARVGDIAYIQNQILEGNNDIYSIQTYIGNNVTNQQEPGNVIVENGNTTITHTNGVHITNGFTVKNGAEFLIIKQ